MGKKLVCKKQLCLGTSGWSDEQCIAKLKHWLLAGFSIDPSLHDARTQHVMKTDCRSMPDNEDGLDAELKRLLRRSEVDAGQG